MNAFDPEALSRMFDQSQIGHTLIKFREFYEWFDLERDPIINFIHHGPQSYLMKITRSEDKIRSEIY